MSEEEKKQEEQVFNQKLSAEDLDAAAGGFMYCGEAWSCSDASRAACNEEFNRPMYGPDGNQFPFCAATVEEGSMCFTNDGCRHDSVVYDGMRSCERAHR